MERYTQACTTQQYKSLPEVIPMKPNTLPKSEVPTTYPGEHVADALRVSNQMAGNLENQDHRVTVKFLNGVVFSGKM